jgi:hypothetical protein
MRVASGAEPGQALSRKGRKLSSETLHEDAKAIGPVIIDKHRAIASLMEEFEAVDWYDQRVAATTDNELKAVLAHNRDEEKEHAAMVLEWLRRHDPVLNRNLRKYLFTDQPFQALIAAEKAKPSTPEAPDGHLRIGSLRRVPNED